MLLVGDDDETAELMSRRTFTPDELMAGVELRLPDDFEPYWWANGVP